MASPFMRFILKGDKKLLRDLRTTETMLRGTLPQKLRAAGETLADYAKREIKGNRTRARRQGREPGVYGKQKYKTKTGKTRNRFVRTNRISGKTLANDTGTLRRSIGSRVSQGGIWNEQRGRRTFRGITYSLEIGTNLVYAAIHEYGGTIRVTPRMRAYLHASGKIHLRKTTSSIRMPKRPYMEPGLRKGLPEAKRIIRTTALRIVKSP